MVGFQKNRIQIQQMVDGILVIVAQIRSYCNGFISRLDPVGHRVRRIVVDVEGKHVHVSHRKLHVRQHRVEEFLRILSQSLDLLYFL